MSFPSSIVLDDFNRADEQPLSGGWSGHIYTSGIDLAVRSNKLAALVSSDVDAKWNTTYGSTQSSGGVEVYATISTVDSSNVELFWNVSTPGPTTSKGYYCSFGISSGTANVIRMNGDSTETTLLSSSAGSVLVNGDKIGIRHIDNSITIWQFHSGVWTNFDSTSDSTYTNGYLGVSIIFSSIMRLDDFGGGNPNPTIATPNFLNFPKPPVL